MPLGTQCKHIMTSMWQTAGQVGGCHTVRCGVTSKVPAKHMLKHTTGSQNASHALVTQVCNESRGPQCFLMAFGLLKLRPWYFWTYQEWQRLASHETANSSAAHLKAWKQRKQGFLGVERHEASQKVRTVCLLAQVENHKLGSGLHAS